MPNVHQDPRTIVALVTHRGEYVSTAKWKRDEIGIYLERGPAQTQKTNGDRDPSIQRLLVPHVPTKRSLTSIRGACWRKVERLPKGLRRSAHIDLQNSSYFRVLTGVEIDKVRCYRM